MSKAEDLIRLFECAAVAMKNAAEFISVRSHNFERVVPRVALMNDNIESELDREIELLFKETRLFRFVRAVVNLRFDFFFCLALQGAREYLHLFPFRCFNARQTMIIETGFTDGDDAWILRQFAQGRCHIFFGFPGISGMNADHGVNVGILFGDLDRAAAAFDGGADGDDARYAGRGGAL